MNVLCEWAEHTKAMVGLEEVGELTDADGEVWKDIMDASFERWPDRTRLFCLGSAHGDDQIGWCVGDALRAADFAAAAEICYLNHAWQLPGRLERNLRIIVVDACCPGGAGDEAQFGTLGFGTVLRLGWPDSRLTQLRGHSTHASSLVEALELSEVLGSVPEEVVVFAVVAGEFAPTSLPAPEVRAAIPEVIRLILLELERWNAADRGGDGVRMR